MVEYGTKLVYDDLKSARSAFWILRNLDVIIIMISVG